MELGKRQNSLTGAFQLPVKMKTASEGVRRIIEMLLDRREQFLITATEIGNRAVNDKVSRRGRVCKEV